MNGHAMETATVGGGCFWCLEAVFEQLDGVEQVVSGFAGGAVKNPSYNEVCGGRTGHAEVTQITFDPARISYRDLLEIFFAFHDPTTLNRQGPDSGTQYRSVILWHSDEQRHTAAAVVAELDAAGIWPHPVVTEVAPFTAFYAADQHHQGEEHPIPQLRNLKGIGKGGDHRVVAQAEPAQAASPITSG